MKETFNTMLSEGQIGSLVILNYHIVRTQSKIPGGLCHYCHVYHPVSTPHWHHYMPHLIHPRQRSINFAKNDTFAHVTSQTESFRQFTISTKRSTIRDRNCILQISLLHFDIGVILKSAPSVPAGTSLL